VTLEMRDTGVKQGEIGARQRDAISWPSSFGLGCRELSPAYNGRSTIGNKFETSAAGHQLGVSNFTRSRQKRWTG
jgi:hypothetical protein